MPANHNLLHIEDVYKHYGNKLILDNIDLSVAEGEFVTVVGPSGCGKSTLLRLILGQEKPSKGKLLISGDPAGHADINRGIVYQKYSLFPHLTVLENVILGKKLTKADRPYLITEEGMHYLQAANLAEHAHKYPHELSGGMQQRVAVMQALIMRPKILLMDEPFGALDPGTREAVQLFLLDVWNEHKMTIFFVTHDLEEAVFLGSRIVVLSQYYTDDRGLNAERGAKIVTDNCIGHIAKDRRLEKTTAMFGELIESIRQQGFNPSYKQHVREFDLSHQHSFATLTAEESTNR